MQQRQSPSSLSLSSSNSRRSLPLSNLNQMPTSTQFLRRRRSILSALLCLILKILSCKTLFHQFGSQCIISRIIITNQFYLERETFSFEPLSHIILGTWNSLQKRSTRLSISFPQEKRRASQSSISFTSEASFSSDVISKESH